jgi:hypothetical protein
VIRHDLRVKKTLSLERTMAPFASRYNRRVQLCLGRIFGHPAIVAMASDALLPFAKTFGLGKGGIVGLKILAR